jgi:hypothetical protein
MPTTAPVKPTAKPTSAPVKPTPSPVKPTASPVKNRSLDCYDTTATFSVTGYGTQSCIWLAARSSMQTELCPEQNVQTACPRTCKVCTSNCNDSTTGTFLDNSNISRNCLWLSIRANKWNTYCSEANVAALCPVTCQTC